jgi:hypothetical protein
VTCRKGCGATEDFKRWKAGFNQQFKFAVQARAMDGPGVRRIGPSQDRDTCSKQPQYIRGRTFILLLSHGLGGRFRKLSFELVDAFGREESVDSMIAKKFRPSLKTPYGLIDCQCRNNEHSPLAK